MSGKEDIELEGTETDLIRQILRMFTLIVGVTFEKHPVKCCEMKKRGDDPTDARYVQVDKRQNKLNI